MLNYPKERQVGTLLAGHKTELNLLQAGRDGAKTGAGIVESFGNSMRGS